MKKRSLSILLILTLLAGLLPAGALAAGGDTPTVLSGGFGGEYDLIAGRTSFPASGDTADRREVTFYYSDGYFFAPGGAEHYLGELSTLSACVALAGSGEPDAEVLRKLLEDMGCREVLIASAGDGGAALARKELSGAGAGCTLIPVVPLGGGDCFYLGASGEHAGFAAAADALTALVEDYIREQDLTGALAAGQVVFWLAGYGENGAVANLTARRLLDAWGEQGTAAPGNAVFAYTFAAPRAGDGENTGVYAGIHNVVSPDDLTARLFPAGTGLCRYGEDHLLPGSGADTEALSGMEAQLAQFAPDLSAPDGFSRARLNLLALMFGGEPLVALDDGVTAERWLDGLVSDLFSWGVCLKTDGDGQPVSCRESYVSYTNHLCRDGSESVTIQEGLCLVGKVLSSMDPDRREALSALLPGLKDRLDLSALMAGLTGWSTSTEERKREFLWGTLWDALLGDEEQPGLSNALSRQELAKLEQAFPVLGETAVSFLLRDLDSGSWSADPDLPAGAVLVHTATLLHNAQALAWPHLGEVTLAWLRSCDENYAAGGPDDPCAGYADIDRDRWYHRAVDYALTSGLMVGTGDGKFDPEGTMSRAMLCQILYNIAGQPSVEGESGFTDVDRGAWYAPAVAWACEAGLVSGCGGGRFCPMGAVTREQLATILYHYEQSRGGGFTGLWMFLLDFPDAGRLSDWASEGMHWCVMKGIVSGKSGGLLDPQGEITRAEAAQLLMNYLEL